MQQVEFRTSRSLVGQIAPAFERDYAIGSDASSPIRISGALVLPRHARCYWRDDRLWIEPIGDAPLVLNGVPLTGPAAARDGDWLVFGDASIQLRYTKTADEAPAAPASAARTPDPGLNLRVGRLPDCALSIDSPLISREHARLYLADGRAFVEDLRSTNGTSVNGARIFGPTPLRPGDRVSFASFVYVFSGTALEPAEAGNRIRIAALGLTRTVRDRATGQPRHLLNRIDLIVNPGEFVAIFGTSGSGKSTLLDALNGRRPASSGRVAYNGVDLYRSFDLFRAGIGYVPQQDIVHRGIRVRDALRYTARLRLPPDTSAGEIDRHIERVLARVGLSEKADLIVDTPEPLSGGQLKRVSLAVELVANPGLLFLDEATSGLDAGTDKKMMRLFADLAADGKTLVCVTHSMENVDCCHLVALLHHGVLVYYGPPGAAAAHFGVARLSDVYDALESRDVAYWRERFLNSPFHERYVSARRAAEPPVESDPSAPAAAPPRIRRPWFNPRQALALTQRSFDLLRSDRLNLLVLLLQAPLIALVVGLVFDTGGSLAERAGAESQIAFVLVLSAIWFGGINSAREIVKELPVYLRERAVTITLPAYLASKLIPLTLLCLIQCASFLLVVTWMLDLSGPLGQRLLTLCLAGLAATAMGLTVSAFVNSNDKAIAALPLLLIPQFILSGAMVPLGGVTETLARLTVIAYWGLDAMRATLDAELLALRDPTGALLIPVATDQASALAALGIQTLVFLSLTLAGLKLKDRRV